jgi:hypothetical protein
MKNLLKFFLGLAVALGVGWAQAGDFEGEVDMTMTTNNDKTLPIQYFVKGHKARTKTTVTGEKGSFSGSSIYDWQTNQIIILMDSQKMYMVSQVHPEKWHYQNNNNYKITDTGKSENILGHDAEEWDWTSDNDNGKVWLTTGIGSWWGSQMAAQANKLPPDQRALVSMVVSKKLFPMKWETDDKSGKMRNSAVVTKVEAKSLGDDMFEPPSDYKKFDMGNMFGNAASNSAQSSGSSSGQDALSGVKANLPF